MEKDLTEMSDDEVMEYLQMLEDQEDDQDESAYDMTEDEIKEAEEALKANSKINLGDRMNGVKQVSINTKRRRVFEIKNEHVKNNRTHELYVEIDKSILTEIILIKTKDLQRMIDNAKNYVSKKAEMCLSKKIPTTLKDAYRRYRQTFINHPGFLYTACEAYGGGKLWIQPDIPYYFEQFTEMNVINKYFLHLRTLMDKNVQSYHKNTARMLKLENKIATHLVRVKTLINLLELDVAYYEMYIKIRQERMDALQKVNLEIQEDKLYKQRYKGQLNK